MRYDLHIHTKYSKCSLLPPKILLKKAKEKCLNGIAVTDHNTIKGALETKKLNKDKNFEVIVGEEIKTDKGDVIGLYLKKEIKPGKFEDVIKEIKKQGGLVVIPHPFTSIGILRRSIKLKFEDIKDKIDAIETFNARFFFKFENLKAKIKAKELNIAETGGSDAHFCFEVGRAYTEFGGSLRKALKNKVAVSKGSILLAFPARVLSIIPIVLNFFKKLITT